MNNLIKYILRLVFIFPFQVQAQSAFAGGESAIGSGELLRIISGLIIVLLIIVFLSWLLKRLNRSGLGLGGPFQIIACASVGAREKIMIVKIGQRFLLLGVASASINTLCDFGESLPEGFNPESKPSFAELLKQIRGKT